jgi:hypothetical protein
MTASRPVEVARETATKSTKQIVPNDLQLGAFRLPRLRFYRDFPQLQGECRGIILCKDGARPAFPCRHSGLTKVPAHSRAIRSCDSATLGSNPRKPSNQSMPSHIYVFNKEKTPYIPVRRPKLRHNSVSVKHSPCLSIVSLLMSPEMRSYAGMAQQTRERRLRFTHESAPS